MDHDFGKCCECKQEFIVTKAKEFDYSPLYYGKRHVDYPKLILTDVTMIECPCGTSPVLVAMGRLHDTIQTSTIKFRLAHGSWFVINEG